MAAVCSVLWLTDTTDSKVKWSLAIGGLIIGLAAHLVFENLNNSDFTNNLKQFETLGFDLKLSDKLIVLAETIKVVNQAQFEKLIFCLGVTVPQIV